MLLAHGWAVLQSSREKYASANPDDWFTLDEQSQADDKKLWADFTAWMNTHADPFIIWQLIHLNNHHGLLQFSVSRNHRGCSIVWDMLDWLANSSESNYAIVYVHDDEDLKGNTKHGRGKEDHSNNYRIWRVLKGEVQEFEDTLLSPIVPTILPNFEA